MDSLRENGTYIPRHAAKDRLSDFCLAEFAGYGACIRQSCHPGAHVDANGYEFVTQP